jgi:2-methylisocitrate lyase-like PEP mutase family enzyme
VRWLWWKAGAKALATGSHPVGDASGFGDAQQVPLDFVLANAGRIVGAIDPLPLTVDFEGAYSTDPEEGGRNAARPEGGGAVGCNFEDQVIGGEAFTRSSCRSAGSRRSAAPSELISSSMPAPIFI